MWSSISPGQTKSPSQSSAPRGTAPPAMVGQIYDGSRGRQREAFSGPVVERQPYTDEWGTVLSGYAPIRDAAGAVRLAASARCREDCMAIPQIMTVDSAALRIDTPASLTRLSE